MVTSQKHHYTNKPTSQYSFIIAYVAILMARREGVLLRPLGGAGNFPGGVRSTHCNIFVMLFYMNSLMIINNVSFICIFFSFIDSLSRYFFTTNNIFKFPQ